MGMTVKGGPHGFKPGSVKQIMAAVGARMGQPLGMDRQSIRSYVEEALRDPAARRKWNILRHPVENTRDVFSMTEAAPRLGEAEGVLKKMGWKEGTAPTLDMVIEAERAYGEVTTDFARRGASPAAQWMARNTPFMNPGIQGLSKFARTIRANPKRAALTGLAAVTLPAVANWWINKDDPDWIRLPAWVKWGFLNIPTGKDETGHTEFLRIPTPFEWWWAFGAIPVAMIDSFYRANPAAFGKTEAAPRPEGMGEVLAQAGKQAMPPSCRARQES